MPKLRKIKKTSHAIGPQRDMGRLGAIIFIFTVILSWNVVAGSSIQCLNAELVLHDVSADRYVIMVIL